MPNRKCFVPNCNSGYASCKEKVSLFSVTENRVCAWSSAIPRKDRILSTKDVVCEKHFNPQYIIREWKAPNSTITIPLKKCKLSDDALPTIFPNCPLYMSKNLKRRKPPTTRYFSESKPVKIRKLHDVTVQTLSETTNNLNSYINTINLSDITLPSENWSACRVHVNDNNEMLVFLEIVYSEYLTTGVIRKKMTVLNNAPEFYYGDKQIIYDEFGIQYEPIESALIANMLQKFSEMKVCSAGPSVNEFKEIIISSGSKDFITSTWRHNKCEAVLQSDANCIYCVTLNDTLRIAFSRKPGTKSRIRQKLQFLKNKDQQRLYIKNQRAKRRIIKKNKLTQQKIKNLQIEYKNVLEIDISDKLKQQDIPRNQQLLVSECIKSGKCIAKNGRRYSTEWILNCLLLNIRNSSVYNYLRENNILPLPAPSTVRRYLHAVDSKCGIDKKFFELFQKKIQSMSDKKRHGILIFDEMTVRTNLDVNVRNMTLSGMVDFGEENYSEVVHDANTNNLADHALVFMFASLCDKYCQPVAVYGCKGATKGSLLVKLLLQILCECEKHGAIVDGIVCDGASTNRSLWTALGISGALGNVCNKFKNPMDEQRNVYVFADAPHLIKCMRNRIYSKNLKVEGQTIKWDHYRSVFEQDSNIAGNLKVCPKISQLHIEPTNMLKMRVKLATQIFSNAMYNGLIFYKNRGVSELLDADGTICLTKRFNDLFDVLNRKYPAEGVRINSPDFQILENNLEFLNKWEEELYSGAITKQEFLTESTAQGLRVSLTSTLELTKYLLEKCDFNFVLTTKMNQDPLERFFGIIRQAGCQNDHPTFHNFLQLYRMLSIYKLLKPPKCGNCTVFAEDKEPETIIPFEEFKKIFPVKQQTFQQNHIAQLKQKLDNYIDQETECDQIIDHDYAKAEVVDCIIYYVTGFVTKKLLKHTACINCRSGLQLDPHATSSCKESELTSLKSLGKLIYPNSSIFKLFLLAEKNLNNNWNNVYAYENVLNDTLVGINFSFPCEEHKFDIISHALHYYILLRLRQHSTIINKNAEKKNIKHKKIAKLQTT